MAGPSPSPARAARVAPRCRQSGSAAAGSSHRSDHRSDGCWRCTGGTTNQMGAGGVASPKEATNQGG
eukprot:5661866-Prymnesium_polylepis.1